MEPQKPDDDLSTVLQQWRLRPAPNPEFRPRVWQRIAQSSRDSWANYVRGHRLGLAVATVVVIGAAGWTGHAAAEAKLTQDREAMVVSYLVGLDPRVQARLRP